MKYITKGQRKRKLEKIRLHIEAQFVITLVFWFSLTYFKVVSSCSWSPGEKQGIYLFMQKKAKFSNSHPIPPEQQDFASSNQVRTTKIDANKTVPFSHSTSMQNRLARWSNYWDNFHSFHQPKHKNLHIQALHFRSIETKRVHRSYDSGWNRSQVSVPTQKMRWLTK